MTSIPNPLPELAAADRRDMRRSALDYLLRTATPATPDILRNRYGFSDQAVREHAAHAIGWATRQHAAEQAPRAACVATAGAGAAGAIAMVRPPPLVCPVTRDVCTFGHERCGDFGCYREG